MLFRGLCCIEDAVWGVSMKEGITLFEIEIYKDRICKKIRKKKVSQSYLYIFLEDDKTSGYVSYGGIMLQINTHKEERILEKEKLWFD